MRIKNTPKHTLLGLALMALGTLAFGQGDHTHVTDHGHGADDPLLAKVMIDQLESGDHSSKLDAQAWLGKDLHKLWFKTDIEQTEGRERGDKTTEAAELQALYSRAISPYWDLQLGLRHDQRPTPSRDWAVLGIQGLAPYFFEVEAAVFVGQQGRSAARLKADYDLLFTQKLVLSPELELNAYGQTDAVTGTGSGLADSRTGLRLRYEIRRELAPYLGVEWHKDYGETADLSQARGKPASERQWVFGIRVWY
jgi:copper resistance protein B